MASKKNEARADNARSVTGGNSGAKKAVGYNRTIAEPYLRGSRSVAKIDEALRALDRSDKSADPSVRGPKTRPTAKKREK